MQNYLWITIRYFVIFLLHVSAQLGHLQGELRCKWIHLNINYVKDMRKWINLQCQLIKTILKHTKYEIIGDVLDFFRNLWKTILKHIKYEIIGDVLDFLEIYDKVSNKHLSMLMSSFENRYIRSLYLDIYSVVSH